jgi:4-hydroxy-2-oxoheptanedioate aldolase
MDLKIDQEQRRINTELCLMAQIETREAVDRVAELCSVPGIGAVFFGLGDLSASLGVPGQTDHPCVLDAVDGAIAVARQSGRLIAVVANATDAGAWAAKGVNLLSCGSDISFIRTAAQGVVSEYRASLAKTQ